MANLGDRPNHVARLAGSSGHRLSQSRLPRSESDAQSHIAYCRLSREAFVHSDFSEGQSSPEDVACGMFVGLSGVTAALAGEFCLGDAILRCCVATLFADGGRGYNS